LQAENSDFSGASSYFYIIAKKDPVNAQKYIPIMRSEIINYGSKTNIWRLTKIPLSAISSGKGEISNIDNVEFQIQLYRHSKEGDHRMISSKQITIMGLIEGNEILDFKGLRDDEYSVKVTKRALITIPSFLDYINAGLDMNLIIGVDFTGSNGNPASPSSLHYIHSANNQYMSAIFEVSQIMLNFDTDKQVPLFGFGACLPHYSKQVSH
jgi:hypothetical protein